MRTLIGTLALAILGACCFNPVNASGSSTGASASTATGSSSGTTTGTSTAASTGSIMGSTTGGACPDTCSVTSDCCPTLGSGACGLPLVGGFGGTCTYSENDNPQCLGSTAGASTASGTTVGAATTGGSTGDSTTSDGACGFTVAAECYNADDAGTTLILSNNLDYMCDPCCSGSDGSAITVQFAGPITTGTYTAGGPDGGATTVSASFDVLDTPSGVGASTDSPGFGSVIVSSGSGLSGSLNLTFDGAACSNVSNPSFQLGFSAGPCFGSGAPCGSGTGQGSGTGGSTSGSGTGSSGSSGGLDAGFTSVTFTTVDIHPAAKAALLAAGTPVPSLTSTSPAGGPYKLVLQGVAIAPGPTIVVNTLFSTPITNTGPYTFSLYNGQIVAEAPLGLLAGIDQSLPDGGSPPPTDAGLVQLPCRLVEGIGGIAAALMAGGIADYFLPTGSQVGDTPSPPTADVTNAVAYAVPMSYASMLNCAGQPSKTSRDSDLGVALVYVTDGGSAAIGDPLPGVTFALQHIAGGSEPAPVYYTNDYAGTASIATDFSGVATFVDVITGAEPLTLGSTDMAGDSFFVPGIASSPNSFFDVFVYIP